MKTFPFCPELAALLPHRRTALIALIGAFGVLVSSGRADIDSINRNVWKMQFAVTDAQLADSNWLSSDSDGDGMKNGDEIAAGTNPFDAGKVAKISAITMDATNVSLTFSTAKGKQYIVQGAVSLPGFVNLTPAVTWNATSNSTKTLVAPQGTNKFFRVLVQDMDTDADGVSDWAEYVVGYNPNSNKTNGIDLDGAALPVALANENKVSITATDSVALQPEGSNAPVDVGQVTVTRSGNLHFAPITVPLTKGGRPSRERTMPCFPPR